MAWTRRASDSQIEHPRSGGAAVAPTPRPKPKRRFPPEVLDDAEARALVASCRNTGRWTGVRNAALIAVLYRAGLRVSEALALRPKDLDLARGMIRVLRGKGGRDRVIGIDPGGAELLKRWLTRRAEFGFDGSEPVFCTRTGGQMTTAYVRRVLPVLAARSGILKRVHAHGLRHTHAAQLREEGVDIGIISKQLGHRSITTTAGYLDHIAPFELVEAVRARAW